MWSPSDTFFCTAQACKIGAPSGDVGAGDGHVSGLTGVKQPGTQVALRKCLQLEARTLGVLWQSVVQIEECMRETHSRAQCEEERRWVRSSRDREQQQRRVAQRRVRHFFSSHRYQIVHLGSYVFQRSKSVNTHSFFCRRPATLHTQPKHPPLLICPPEKNKKRKC